LKEPLSKNNFKITLSHSNGFRGFLSIINFGTYSDPQLKFTFYKAQGRGFINFKNDIDSSLIMGDVVEYSYHKDGSALLKNPKSPMKWLRYINPQGTGYRRIPLKEITSVETILHIGIHDLKQLPLLTPKQKQQFMGYDAPNIFNGKFSIYVSIVNSNYHIAKGMFTTEAGNIWIKSNLIDNIAEGLSLWLLFVKDDLPSTTFYSEKFKRLLSVSDTNFYKALKDDANSVMIRQNNQLLNWNE
ncbi:MAG: hypothetical protein LIP05_14980, partial [Tannerellaceae bacterium]|nr:hypothetical protein [Tannerellaceae bacterium]